MALTRAQMRAQLQARGIVRVVAQYDDARAFSLIGYTADGTATPEAVGDDTLWPIARAADVNAREGTIEWNVTTNKIDIRAAGRVFGHDQSWVA